MSAIAITGAGAIYGRSLERPRHLHALDLPVGEVPFTNADLKDRLGISAETEVSRTSLLGATAAKAAIMDANLDIKRISGRRVAFISGTTVGGMDITERHFSEMLSDARCAALLTHHHCGANTEEIADICGLGRCYRSTVSTACSSALNAIIQGARMLLTGEADIAIAGGAEALTRFHLLGFNSLKILDSAPCRPFDACRQGLNLAEGAGFVVLERADDAMRRGAKTLGYVAGYGNRCDAHHQTATSENGEGAYLAMTDALRMSGLKADEIDYINAHGTGTPDNDQSESAALRRVFGDIVPPVSSTKSLTGHTTSASGGIETVICLKAMADGVIPANLRWENRDEQCIVPVTEAISADLRHVLCNSFGFGGNDSSIIISDTPVDLPCFGLADVKCSSSVEISDEAELGELGKYVGPMERRRMSLLMKAATLTSLKALEEAGIESPDAIIVATNYGMLEQGEKMLEHISAYGEEGLSPTLFMQSTHNTIAGSLAIRLKCHGWNMTYSHGEQSLDHALAEASRIISEGHARNVLVGLHDYLPEGFNRRLNLAGIETSARLVSKSMVISKNE